MTAVPYMPPPASTDVAVTSTGTVALLIDGVPVLELAPWGMAALAARMATVAAEAALDSAKEATDPVVLVARLAQVLGTPDGDRTTANLAAQLPLSSLGATPVEPAPRGLPALDQADVTVWAADERLQHTADCQHGPRRARRLDQPAGEAAS